MEIPQLASRILAARQSLRLSQSAAAIRGRVDRGTLARWERGDPEDGIPVTAHVERYLARLEVDEGLETEVLALCENENLLANPHRLAAFYLAMLRARSGLSLRRLAENMGLGKTQRSLLAKWERGMGPSRERIGALLDALGAPDPLRPMLRELFLTGETRAIDGLPGSPHCPASPFLQGEPELLWARLSTFELHARRLARQDPSWWDWLSELQLAAVREFVYSSDWIGAHQWATRSIVAHPGSHRNPHACRTIRSLFFVSAPLSEKRKLKFLNDQLGFANSLEGSELTWVLSDAARMQTTIESSSEARKNLARALDSSPSAYPIGSDDRVGFESGFMIAEGNPEAAEKLLDSSKGSIFQSTAPEDRYRRLWLGGLWVKALVDAGAGQKAFDEAASYLAFADGLGIEGSGWARKLRSSIPHSLLRSLDVD